MVSALSDGDDAKRGDSVIERAVRILDAFSPDTTALSVNDLARRAGLPTSTTSRLVAELVRHGLLQRDQDRRVRVGVRLWELASRASPTRGLREAALPVMEDLHAAVGHHTQLGVLDGHDVLFVERLSAPGSITNFTQVAGRLPLHASSAGQVLLAHAPAAVQEAVLAAPLRRYTARTVTDPVRLRAVLATIRKQGYAYCPGHIALETSGLAVPVRDRRDRVVAALAVIVPNDEAALTAVPALTASARGIQRSLRPVAGELSR